ncbi:MAG: DUF4290 domain-containing protein [Saprospiraceae bacterium]|nr:DUF4290 domain-containing protein [Saprospiraceae bacterium]
MTNVIDLDYNSQKDNLVISEYGRYVQELIDWCKTIEDPQARQIAADNIVEIMRIVNPQKNANEDTTDKLWQHFFRIADYQLDVKSSTGETPEKPNPKEIVRDLHYPVQEVKFRHYGHNIQQLVKKAQAMEPSEKRKELIVIIGSYMKLAYKTWNREPYVSDEVIKGDLEALSGNTLTLEDGIQFDTALAQVSYSQQTTTNTRRSKYGSRSSGRGRSGGSYNKNRRRR